MLMQTWCPADFWQDAFLDLMLPVLNRTLRHFDVHNTSSAGGSRLSAALRRRLRLLNKNRGAHEQGVVFKVDSSPPQPSQLRACLLKQHDNFDALTPAPIGLLLQYCLPIQSSNERNQFSGTLRYFEIPHLSPPCHQNPVPQYPYDDMKLGAGVCDPGSAEAARARGR